MRRILTTLLPLTVLTLTGCEGGPAPFGPPVAAQRGIKARTFDAIPDEAHPAVIDVLAGMGYEIHTDSPDRQWIMAHTVMDATVDAMMPEQREWIRVTVALSFVDRHARAPRTLVKVEAVRMQGSAEGPIEASSGTVASAFYERFFRQVEIVLARYRGPRPYRDATPPPPE